MKNLDRHRTRHRRLRRAVHGAHAPGANLVQDPKFAPENFALEERIRGLHAMT
jgi:hypothetical protein